MKIIKTKENQTIFDIAVKCYGNMEAVGELLDNNPGLRNAPASLSALGIDYLSEDGFYLDAALAPGQDVVIEGDSFMLKQDLVKELQNKEINTFGL